jgi:DUF1365 family protein
MHRRFRPRLHKFRYRAFWLLIDLKEPEALSRRLRLLAFNRFGIFSFHEADHGDGGGVPLAMQVTRHLAAAGIDLGDGAIRLFCMPRILGYVFNPLSIYFCHRADGGLAALLYEVSNTFGQRHSYLIPVAERTATIHQRCDKAFYVSPFLAMEMSYDFSIRVPAQQVAVAIRAQRSGLPVMPACLTAAREALTDGALLRAFLKIPLLTLKVTAAIHWEALRLWLKGVRLVRRPVPPSRAISTAPPLPD